MTATDTSANTSADRLSQTVKNLEAHADRLGLPRYKVESRKRYSVVCLLQNPCTGKISVEHSVDFYSASADEATGEVIRIALSLPNYKGWRVMNAQAKEITPSNGAELRITRAA